MDPNTSAIVYCQQAQTFISHLTYVCMMIIALATLVSLVFTIVTAVIGSSVYKLNKDLREEHDKLSLNIQDELSKLKKVTVEYKTQIRIAQKMTYNLTTDPKLKSSREFLDSFIDAVRGKKYKAGTQTGETVSAMYSLSELGSMEDMKRLVKIRDLAKKHDLDEIKSNATSALLRIAEKQG